MQIFSRQKNSDRAAIQIEGLHKNFGNFSALNNLSLEVKRGEIYGFLGLNGAGKTTTIKTLLAMLRPSSGKLHILGERVYAGNYKLWDKIGYLEETTFYPELTVIENMDIARRMQRVSDKASVNQAICKMGLEPYKNKKARNLSMGNKQRLGLAKAIIHNPQVLILDEPINALDPAGVVEVRNMLNDLANSGVTVFISSHLIEELSKVATRIGIIHNGHLVQEIEMDRLEQVLQKNLALDGRDRNAIKRVLKEQGYTFEEMMDGHFKLTDSHAVDAPERLVELLVGVNQPPTLLRIMTETLEGYFLRTIEITGGNQ
ncbi:ABC-type multidrug transport system, ATpase component [Clostridium aceticum]|uniref:ABC-type multidrug transport system, ATpase component n=1 Tax=Clostridium aceticum TaxID=84022 RepID=A0A0D8I663_9CLOT|nr:ABC transporter ATP-binding protein [Clostridium aceticum]AKL96125.1 ABC-type multidrug transport system, ATpase component [Clostridium aceticum]KJF25512.1 bacitracin ABC transporter ATP-binding protein [Clostridium aceticum]